MAGEVQALERPGFDLAFVNQLVKAFELYDLVISLYSPTFDR